MLKFMHRLKNEDRKGEALIQFCRDLVGEGATNVGGVNSRKYGTLF